MTLKRDTAPSAGNHGLATKCILRKSCDVDAPRLITNIETSPTTTPDDNMIKVVHQSLKGRNIIPSNQLADKG
jgi:transposase